MKRYAPLSIPGHELLHAHASIRLERSLQFTKSDQTSLQLASLAVTPTPSLAARRKAADEMTVTILPRAEHIRAQRASSALSMMDLTELAREFDEKMPYSTFHSLGDVAIAGINSLGTRESPFAAIELDSPELIEEIQTALGIIHSISGCHTPHTVRPHISIAQFEHNDGHIDKQHLAAAERHLPETLQLSPVKFA